MKRPATCGPFHNDDIYRIYDEEKRMIRRLKPTSKPRIPAEIRAKARKYPGRRFYQSQLDNPITSIAKMIPYPIERQFHSLVVLGDGGVETHTDDLDDFLATAYCVPFHIPKNARLWQEDECRVMEEGECYSFNHERDHAVDSPEGCQTYAAFIVVDILKKSIFDELNHLAS